MDEEEELAFENDYEQENSKRELLGTNGFFYSPEP